LATELAEAIGVSVDQKRSRLTVIVRENAGTHAFQDMPAQEGLWNFANTDPRPGADASRSGARHGTLRPMETWRHRPNSSPRSSRAGTADLRRYFGSKATTMYRRSWASAVATKPSDERYSNSPAEFWRV